MQALSSLTIQHQIKKIRFVFLLYNFSFQKRECVAFFLHVFFSLSLCIVVNTTEIHMVETDVQTEINNIIY